MIITEKQAEKINDLDYNEVIEVELNISNTKEPKLKTYKYYIEFDRYDRELDKFYFNIIKDSSNIPFYEVNNYSVTVYHLVLQLNTVGVALFNTLHIPLAVCNKAVRAIERNFLKRVESILEEKETTSNTPSSSKPITEKKDNEFDYINDISDIFDYFMSKGQLDQLNKFFQSYSDYVQDFYKRNEDTPTPHTILDYFHNDYEPIQRAKHKALSFVDDVDKMIDFLTLTKYEFLQSYSYLTEEEYDATAGDMTQSWYSIMNKLFIVLVDRLEELSKANPQLAEDLAVVPLASALKHEVVANVDKEWN